MEEGKKINSIKDLMTEEIMERIRNNINSDPAEAFMDDEEI